MTMLLPRLSRLRLERIETLPNGYSLVLEHEGQQLHIEVRSQAQEPAPALASERVQRLRSVKPLPGGALNFSFILEDGAVLELPAEMVRVLAGSAGNDAVYSVKERYLRD